MRELALVLFLFLILIFSFNSANADFIIEPPPITVEVIIEGNIDRGESPYPLGGGRMIIDVYAHEIFDMVSVYSGFDFISGGDNFNHFFQISIDQNNPAYADFDYQMIRLGESIPLSVIPIFSSERDTAGFALLPGESIDFTEKTLLYSITYDYVVRASGVYTVDINPGLTMITDSSGKEIYYRAVPGKVNIVPEPKAIFFWLFSIFCFWLNQRRLKIQS